MQIIGYDIGSSSVKASLLDLNSKVVLATVSVPETEMKILAEKPGWAEQDPNLWWDYLIEATHKLLKNDAASTDQIAAIGISYQMHGLVIVDKDYSLIRPAIIWCDSRAVDIGEHAFQTLGEEKCLSNLLNSPGNFTASKLKWVKDNEPDNYQRIHKMMLPGDYIAMRLTGEIKTTIPGLSEGILWDFNENEVSNMVMDHFGFTKEIIPEITPTFSHQGSLLQSVAGELGLPAGIPVTYRAGDQPNNAFSLNVLNPGEVAATAGTSGVVYGVTEKVDYDEQSRVNSFIHVNHSENDNRIGVLLCINGTGILNSWVKRLIGSQELSYEIMNQSAAEIPIGSEGLTILPFGNGAERMLGNRDPGSTINHLNFNIHSRKHIFRAVQEGVVFSFRYGMEIMERMGIRPKVIRAGLANMFLSPVFQEALATSLHANIELFNTDGSAGAARGAVVGAGLGTFDDVFSGLEKIKEVYPDSDKKQQYDEAYHCWKIDLHKQFK